MRPELAATLRNSSAAERAGRSPHRDRRSEPRGRSKFRGVEFRDDERPISGRRHRRENPGSIIVRSLAGEQEVKVAELKTRTNTGPVADARRLRGLGAEQLRDIIGYMQSVDGAGFRALDL